MSFITTLTGQQFFLNAIVNADILLLHLYSNDRIPSKTDVVTNYTDVVSAGYAPKLLTPSDWVIAVDALSGDYVATFPEQVFSFDDLLQVYGYYITDHNSANLILAERFTTAPVTLQLGVGGNVKVTPTLKAN
jgi:hypothetical protein